MSVDVESKVSVCEFNGKPVMPGSKPVVKVKNVERSSMLVVLAVNGKEYTVYVDDLRRAIDNVANTSV